MRPRTLWLRRGRQDQIAQPAGEPDLQLRLGAAAASATPAAPAASAAATGDADLPGRLGDPGDGHVPATTTAAAAAAGTRTRLTAAVRNRNGPGAIPGRFLYGPRSGVRRVVVAFAAGGIGNFLVEPALVAEE